MEDQKGIQSLGGKARAEKLMKEAQHDAKARWTLYQQMAAMHYEVDGAEGEKK